MQPSAHVNPVSFDPAHLHDLADQVRLQNAYCPYSLFPVGAAVVCEDGSVFVGVNVENAAFGGTICAERSAVTAAVSAGHRRFVACVVAADADSAPPCGACRQVLAEFCDDDARIVFPSDGALQETPLGDLLPARFRLGR